MSKKEFLQKLEEALLEKMDIAVAMEHIRYYSDYIDSEVAKGKTEEQVVNMLQSPRLIAKSITSNISRANKYDSNISEKKYDNSYSKNDEETYSRKPTFSINGKPVNGTLMKIILICAAILIVGLLIAIITFVTWVLFSFVLPIIVLIMIILLIKNIISKGR